MSDKHENSRWQKKLKENDLGWRILIGLICVVCMGLFLHFREVKVEMLELHATASRYVVAQVDFEFPDDEATLILRQEALQDVGRIYKIKGKELRQVRFDLENDLIQNPDWRNELPNVSYEEMYKAADAFEGLLLEARFANAHTIQKLKEFEILVNHYLVFNPKTDQEKISLPKEYWRHLREVSFAKILFDKLQGVNEHTIDFVISFFENHTWNLVSDYTAENNLRELIQKNIPQKYTRVKAGTRVIGGGEKVSPRHLAMIQAMKSSLNESRNLLAPLTILGDFLLALILVVISALYLRLDQKDILRSLRKLSLLVCLVILTLAFSKIAEYILLQNTNSVIDAIRYPIIIPFAVILFVILLNYRIAIYGAFLLSIIIAVTLAVDHNRFLILNLIASLVVIIFTKNLRKRNEVFIVCGKSFLGVVPVYIVFALLVNNLFDKMLFYDISSGLFFLLIIAILVVGLLPILESLFNVLTDITLMEYMDPNNELLRQLTIEVPGTYQHSLVLGNIAEAAAQTIGANGLLCRVATLYHDIGKLNNTYYFTENQQSGVNIHQLLTPVESAQVIISHIKDGEMLARKYHLPQSFIDIILQHHGTTLVYYFYCKELELKGGDASVVNEKQFRYPGPKPQTKEAAIIMIADAAEAATRSLDEINEKTLTKMVDSVVNDKADDGQFDECDISFKELTNIKQSIIKSLMVMRHVRVKYPEKKS